MLFLLGKLKRFATGVNDNSNLLYQCGLLHSIIKSVETNNKHTSSTIHTLTKTSCDLFTLVFPRLHQLCVLVLSSHWFIVVLRCTSSTNHMKTTTNRDLVTRVLPRFVPVTYVCLVFLLVHCSVYIVIAFGFTIFFYWKTKTSFGSMITYCYNDNDWDCESPNESSVRRHPTTERNHKTRLQIQLINTLVFWNNIFCSC